MCQEPKRNRPRRRADTHDSAAMTEPRAIREHEQWRNDRDGERCRNRRAEQDSGNRDDSQNATIRPRHGGTRLLRGKRRRRRRTSRRRATSRPRLLLVALLPRPFHSSGTKQRTAIVDASAIRSTRRVIHYTAFTEPASLSRCEPVDVCDRLPGSAERRAARCRGKAGRTSADRDWGVVDVM